jgi:hypothetical protein
VLAPSGRRGRRIEFYAHAERVNAFLRNAQLCIRICFERRKGENGGRVPVQRDLMSHLIMSPHPVAAQMHQRKNDQGFLMQPGSTGGGHQKPIPAAVARMDQIHL